MRPRPLRPLLVATATAGLLLASTTAAVAAPRSQDHRTSSDHNRGTDFDIDFTNLGGDRGDDTRSSQARGRTGLSAMGSFGSVNLDSWGAWSGSVSSILDRLSSWHSPGWGNPGWGNPSWGNPGWGNPGGGNGGSTTFTVTTSHDTVDKKVGDGKCRDHRGRCSLRAAVQEANATSRSTTIKLPKRDTIELTRNGAGNDKAAKGDLDIHGKVTIQGTATIDASGLHDRILD